VRRNHTIKIVYIQKLYKLDPRADSFKMSLNSEIYVDKSNLIAKTNAVVHTRQRFICISRPRRFGKTMAAEMLSAYYSMGEDANELFRDLNIAQHPSYEVHLNKYNVIMINMQTFLSRADSIKEMISELESEVVSDVIDTYPKVKYKKKSTNGTGYLEYVKRVLMITKCT